MDRSATARGRASKLLWLGLWSTLALHAATMVADGLQRDVPAVVWLLWFLPLLVLIPGLLRDRLRSAAWLSFVTLMYFVVAVQRLFAEPDSVRASLELLAVVGVFLTSMFYIRSRGPELRAATEDSADAQAGSAQTAVSSSAVQQSGEGEKPGGSA
ncbi:MAG: DUF2069 domain-containing protein [Halieaceae bacterium]|nr:DUF2069 domain-containing protein [Halieaceae bacterium]